MNLASTIKTDKNTWKIIGGKLIRRIRDDAKKGKGQDGGTFKKYSKGYAERKKSAKSIKGRPIGSQVSPPDLFLTGDMWKSFKVSKYTVRNVIISYFEGDRVIYNKEMGRDVFDVSDKNMEIVANEVSKKHGKNLKKWAAKPIIIKVGK